METKKPALSNTDKYIADQPEDIRSILQQLRETIRAAAPEATETISYQMPTFRLNGNLVHFAACKNHIGFYPTPSAIEAFHLQLTPYKSSKGAIQFPIDQPLPLDVISQIVKFRVEENSRLAVEKKKR